MAALLTWAWKLLKVASRRGLTYSAASLRFLLYGGWKGLIGLTAFFVVPHIAAFQEGLLPGLIFLRDRLLFATVDIARGLEAFPASSAAEWQTAVFSIVTGGIALLWFFRFVDTVIITSFGSDAPKDGRVLVVTGLYVALVWGVTGVAFWSELWSAVRGVSGVWPPPGGPVDHVTALVSGGESVELESVVGEWVNGSESLNGSSVP